MMSHLPKSVSWKTALKESRCLPAHHGKYSVLSPMPLLVLGRRAGSTVWRRKDRDAVEGAPMREPNAKPRCPLTHARPGC